jgi:hypothetical protein
MAKKVDPELREQRTRQQAMLRRFSPKLLDEAWCREGMTRSKLSTWKTPTDDRSPAC